MILLEMGPNALNGLFIMIAFAMVGPPIIFAIIGLSLLRSKPKSAKVFFILAGIYLLIAGGICGAILTSI